MSCGCSGGADLTLSISLHGDEWLVSRPSLVIAQKETRFPFNTRLSDRLRRSGHCGCGQENSEYTGMPKVFFKPHHPRLVALWSRSFCVLRHSCSYLRSLSRLRQLFLCDPKPLQPKIFSNNAFSRAVIWSWIQRFRNDLSIQLLPNNGQLQCYPLFHNGFQQLELTHADMWMDRQTHIVPFLQISQVTVASYVILAVIPSHSLLPKNIFQQWLRPCCNLILDPKVAKWQPLYLTVTQQLVATKIFIEV